MKKLTPELQQIVDDYLASLGKFVVKNKLDTELVSDIKARVLEKIETTEKLNRKEIFRILHEI